MGAVTASVELIFFFGEFPAGGPVREGRAGRTNNDALTQMNLACFRHWLTRQSRLEDAFRS